MERPKKQKKNFMLHKNTINILDVDIDNIVTWKLIKTKTKYEYLSEYLDTVVRLVLILPIRHSKLKMAIKILTINWCLSV